jgi:hypothetical protein
MSLPTKIRMGIRDSWDKPDCTVQKAISELKDLLGYTVTITPQWQLLWTELKPYYPEMANFVPSVGGIVQAWCKSMEILLESDKNAAWTEKALEGMQGARGCTIRLEVRPK